MERGLRRALQILDTMRIVDGDRLPSAIPIPVIAALLADEPAEGDRRARADRLARVYAWRAFFTNRYEATAATRAAADHRALVTLLAGSAGDEQLSVMNEDLYPLPTLRELRAASWPKSKRSLPRAILAASNYFGARDFADDTAITVDNAPKREYHHLFPNQLLSEANLEANYALNCALITWKTNRSIGRQDPLTYLEKRAEHAPAKGDVEDRLASHLVPYAQIATAGPYLQPAGSELRAAVKPDYEAFLDARARLVQRFMVAVCAGEQPQLREVIEGTPAS